MTAPPVFWAQKSTKNGGLVIYAPIKEQIYYNPLINFGKYLKNIRNSLKTVRKNPKNNLKSGPKITT